MLKCFTLWQIIRARPQFWLQQANFFVLKSLLKSYEPLVTYYEHIFVHQIARCKQDLVCVSHRPTLKLASFNVSFVL